MENLYDDILESGKQVWLDKVVKDIKTVDILEKSKSEIRGLVIQPLYTKEDLPVVEEDPAAGFFAEFDLDMDNAGNESSVGPSWSIAEEIYLQKDESLNDMVTDALKRGAHFIRLSVSDNLVWDHAMDQIRKLKYPVNFSFNVSGDLTNENVANVWRERVGFVGERDRLIQSIEFDPISFWLKNGTIENKSKSFNALAEVFFRISGHLQDCRLIKTDVSVDPFSNKGVVHQLAYALAITSDYFDQLSNRNVPLEEAINLFSFRFAVGTDFFIEIAKLRAFKILWNNLLKSFIEDIEFIPAPLIQVVTNNATAGSNEPYQHVLHNTTQAMSAVLGGCDILIISSPKNTENGNEELNKRVAIHIQDILRYESNFDKYKDAATGSFYIENLTAQIAEKAWELFKEIESEGGFLACWEKSPGLERI